jgi:hypothetical protein
MTNNKQCLDIDPLIQLDPSVLGDKSELTDCFSGLFRLFGSPLPQISSPTVVIFHVPHDRSITPYFSALGADQISDLGAIFFGTRSVILRDIPETLPGFLLYVVVNRLSKTNSHLCCRDSEGWFSIRGRDIEEAFSFRRDNISLLGYIGDLKFTNVFRCLLSSNHLLRRPRGKLNQSLDTLHRLSDHMPSPEIPLLPGPQMPTTKSITVVFWPDLDDSPWGSERRETVHIECAASGKDLLTTVSRFFEDLLNRTSNFELVKVSDDLERTDVISPIEAISAIDGGVFHIQPKIDPTEACHVVLTIESNEVDRPIDCRRIRIPSGRLDSKITLEDKMHVIISDLCLRNLLAVVLLVSRLLRRTPLPFQMR